MSGPDKARKLHRLTPTDAATIERALLLQALIGYRETTQRNEISKVLPDLYVLREAQGMTFKQLSSLLRKIGLKLSESSLRVYYCQMLPDRLAECKQRLLEMKPILQKMQDDAMHAAVEHAFRQPH